MSKKKSKRGIILAAALLVLACGGFLYIRVGSQAAELPPKKHREYTVARGDITVGIDAEGKLVSKRIPHGISDGIEVDKILVKTGQKVKKGDKLAELSVPQAEKNREALEEELEEIEEKLEDVREDREDYLLSLNWLLENQKDKSYNAYENKYWEIKNEIYTLEWKIEEAESKREWSDDGELMETALKELNAELAAKEAALEKLTSDREKEKKEEGDLDYQKEKQEEKLREYDGKIDALEKQQTAARKKYEKAASRFITASKDGVVLKINGKNGEKTKGDTPIVELGDNTKLSLHLLADPESIVDIEKGQLVSFYVDAYPDQTFTGKVTEINLVPNSDGKYEISAAVDKSDRELLDGMKAGATIILKQKKDVLTLQNKAIYLENGKQFVKVMGAEGEPEKKEITAGFSDGRVSEILSGLSEGDAVIYEDAE